MKTKTRIDADGLLRGVVAVDLSEILDLGVNEAFLDLVSNRLTGTELLSDIRTRVVGHEDADTLFVEVCGDPGFVIESNADIRKMWNDWERRRNKRRRR
jgi:hypothetical protein